MRARWILGLAAGILAAKADPPPAAAPADSDDLYRLGQQLFDQYAPPEIKQQYEFPSKEQWDQFAVRLQKALDDNSLQELAGYDAEARAALAALRAIPGNEDYADWLALRLDEIEAAEQAVAPPVAGAPPVGRPSPIPLYDLWLARVRHRPPPAGAADLMPRLRAAFAKEGVPPELAWIAEAESSLNPSLRRPDCAAGAPAVAQDAQAQRPPGRARRAGQRARRRPQLPGGSPAGRAAPAAAAVPAPARRRTRAAAA